MIHRRGFESLESDRPCHDDWALAPGFHPSTAPKRMTVTHGWSGCMFRHDQMTFCQFPLFCSCSACCNVPHHQTKTIMTTRSNAEPKGFTFVHLKRESIGIVPSSGSIQKNHVTWNVARTYHGTCQNLLMSLQWTDMVAVCMHEPLQNRIATKHQMGSC